MTNCFTARIVLILVIVSALTTHAYGKINIALTTTQILVNAVPVDSATPLAQIRSIAATDTGRFVSWDDLGFWYVYDGAGVGFHWSADSTRLLSIYIEGHGEYHPAYRPSHDFPGKVFYLSAPLTPFNNIWTLLRRGAGHVISIAPDLYSVYLSHGGYDAEINWYRDECQPAHVRDGEPYHILIKQKMESCVIYLGHQEYSTGRMPLRARGVTDDLFIDDKLTPDTLYSQAHFISEGSPCRDNIPMVTSVDEMEGAFQISDRDSLQVLVKKYFNKIKQKDQHGTDSYITGYNEDAINSDGYSLMDYGQFAGAAAIMQLGTLLYPYSYNAHDSYGDALLSDGHPQLALAEYQIALGSNPNMDYDDHSIRYHTTRHMRLITGRALRFVSRLDK